MKMSVRSADDANQKYDTDLLVQWYGRGGRGGEHRLQGKHLLALPVSEEPDKRIYRLKANQVHGNCLYFYELLMM
jgi:hypothetical protein